MARASDARVDKSPHPPASRVPLSPALWGRVRVGARFSSTAAKSGNGGSPSAFKAHSARRRSRRFERAVPQAVVDIDCAHLDAVLARIADDLRRGVEPHRLAVEQGAGKDFGIEAFDPGRDVNEQCEARRVALGETVGPEPFDLAE